MAAETTSHKHNWRFFRAGGTDQVKLNSNADLENLDHLDKKLWATLSCPARGLEFDTKTLEMIDSDKDGRIRVPEILAAVKWLCDRLKNPSDIINGSDILPLSAIHENTPEGRQILASAQNILKNLGKTDAREISLAETLDTAKIFAQTTFNGDGIIPADSAADASTQTLIADIITCCGSVPDRSGKPGIDQSLINRFFTELGAYADWWKKAEDNVPEILPLGAASEKVVSSFKAVRVKIDDYFARCRLAEFDERALAALNRHESDYLSFAARDLTITGEEIAGFPLARITAKKPLPLKENLNPAWVNKLAEFSRHVIVPLMGDKSSLTGDEWATITDKLTFHEAWLKAKAGVAVEKLGLPRMREILSGNGKTILTDLIAKDKELESEVKLISDIERLIRYYRDLHTLLNNFVSFAHFYGKKEKAIFQAGTLYLDGRACELCVRVDDLGKHGTLASLSKTYLAYCDCTRRGGAEKMTIAAAFTNGDSDYLMVGRNGVFYDRKGQDWDATISKIIDNPISIRQAFWSPYKKFIRLIESQIEKMASAREKSVQDNAAARIADSAKVVEAGSKPGEKKEAFDVAKYVGIFAALALAVGAIGAALGAMIAALSKLAWWQYPLVLAAIMLLISGPSMILAWLKLRQRNLGPILDSNGWAINARVLINIPFGKSLTKIAALPGNSTRILDDPYAEKSHRKTWIFIILFLFLIWIAFAFSGSYCR